MKKIMILLASAVTIQGCSTAASTQQRTEEQTYNSSCLSCHGELADSKNGITLYNIGKTKTNEQIYESIIHPPQGMPANTVSKEDAKRLAKWIQVQTK
ncbi:MAG: cytochrome c [Ectobacillus sp.]